MNYESSTDKKQTRRGAKNNLWKHTNKGEGNPQDKHFEPMYD